MSFKFFKTLYIAGGSVFFVAAVILAAAYMPTANCS
jgi:hypothetical protein